MSSAVTWFLATAGVDDSAHEGISLAMLARREGVAKPSRTSTFQQAFGAARRFQANPNFGLFAQDEWRPRTTLTVNAGLRYDLQWHPAPIELDRNNLSPRLGIAYAPRNGRTVIRASGGVYFDRIPLRATSNAPQRDGSKYKTAVLAFGQAGAPVFPAVLPSFPSGLLVSVSTINPAVRSGYSRQASAQVERAIGNTLSASAGYSYLRGRAIIMLRNVNVPTLPAAQAAALGVPNLGRPNPLFGNITQYDALGDSWFNGFTLSVTSRPAGWGSARVSLNGDRALQVRVRIVLVELSATCPPAYAASNRLLRQ